VLRLDLSKSTIPHQNLSIRTNNGFSMSVNLGPVAPTLAEVGVVSTGSGAAYNPRCLKRDVSVWVSSQVSSQIAPLGSALLTIHLQWNTDTNSSDLITQNTDIASFQTTMQGDFATGF
jgi:tyrosinase